ncbi:hypothetical protein [Acidithiobacillus sp.]|jgi:hypothetical protein|uniref:hypothetical protein n=1 Tax=Acidithiobacillus sp. TaxID=1872118 RepID=UPI0025C5C19E|nr:hypothetical protein [Acidithiobacillus sp.]MCK9188360.1 hypothetical protein [Acidithiobacillus sp.]MCK9358781.1 hypothetical protein [Acidithiobacillus sp.]
MTLPLSAYLELESQVLSWAAGQGWQLQRTGPLRRGEWPLPRLEFLREGVLTPDEWEAALAACPLFARSVSGKGEAWSQEGIGVKFYQAPTDLLGFAQIAHTGPAAFVAVCHRLPGWDEAPAPDEAVAFARVGLPCIPPDQRNPEVFTMLAGVSGG